MNISLIERSNSYKKSYKKLPLSIRKKFEKQITLLLKDTRHPSLKVKKYSEALNIWEARIDRSYRFTYLIYNHTLRLLTIGPHDEGLGKK